MPPDTYGTCAAHFFSRLDESGDLVESAAGRRANRLPTIRLTRAQRLSQDRQELRLALIAKLGGECETCSETSPDLLNIRTYVSRPDDARRGIAWYQWLMAHPEVLASSELRCLRHAAREPDEYRRAVIRAYGGGCSCGETDALQILPMSGTEAPRYPGGRKYSAKDKVRWLAREGFPTGWRLACPDHRD